jgi:alpha/beta superfamily hydrolase
MIAEQSGVLVTTDGMTLEARISSPTGAPGGVVVCHPHPLYGGDMDNPVVRRAVEVCADLGLGTVRFNFRGVGGSTGSHGNGITEGLDVEAALAQLGLSPARTAPVGLIGYSFGAVVAAQVAAAGSRLAGLCLIAPPLAISGDALPRALGAWPNSNPLLVVSGTRDQYCPPSALATLTERVPSAQVRIVDGADHFFLGKLFPLGEAVAGWARSAFQL